MFFDTVYNYIELEQCERPGSIGDALAETTRYITLTYVTGKDSKISLVAFVTDKGILRHPDSPWREDDTSGDQVYPLIAAASLSNPELAEVIIQQIIHNGNRTGNNDHISLGMLGQIERARDKNDLWLSDLPVLAQALIFKVPIRWSDSKKWFEGTKDSSGDYLNYINALAFAKAKNNVTWPLKLAMLLTKKELLLEKVKHYYKIEPNSQWVVDLYEQALKEL